MTFLPVEKHARLRCEGILERIVREEGLSVLGWRDTPTFASAIGRVARASQPYIQQIFVGRPPGLDEDAFERKLYIVRQTRRERNPGSRRRGRRTRFTFPRFLAELSSYKGLVLASQLTNFYRELSDPDVVSALCLVHQRFFDKHFSQLAAGASVSLHRA